MNANTIREGDTLKLKPERMRAYGFHEPLVRVRELRYRAHYKTPHVIDIYGQAFTPADFARRA